jgi:hypothetical protein
LLQGQPFPDVPRLLQLADPFLQGLTR